MLDVRIVNKDGGKHAERQGKKEAENNNEEDDE